MPRTLRLGSLLTFAALLIATTSPAQQGRRPAASSRGPLGRWLGQDGHDYVGPSSALAGSDVQDIHIALGGLPPVEIAGATIRGLGGGEWQVNGPYGPWKAHLIRSSNEAPMADLYLEPSQAENGRPFAITLRFADRRVAEFDVKGGRADPNLRMPSAALGVRWRGQDGTDRVGDGPSVGPDGVQDIHLELERLSPKVEVKTVAIAGPSGSLWETGVNPRGLGNAELVRHPDDRSRGDLFLQSGRDLGGGKLTLKVEYVNGKSDSGSVKAGPVDPRRAVQGMPRLPQLAAAHLAIRWLGQDGIDSAGKGSVHVTLDKLPASIRAAALNDQVGQVWLYKPDASTPFDAGPDTLSLAVIPKGSGHADLAFLPVRDESGSTLLLRLLLADGRTVVASFPGGSADIARRSPDRASTSATARPGDDLQALADRVGELRLMSGVYRLDRPLVLNRPIRISAEPKTTLQFVQPPSSPSWTTAIKIHSGQTVLEGFVVRFEGPVRWTPDINYGPAVIGSTDNHDSGHTDTKAGIVLRNLDIESPPSPEGRLEEAARLVRMATAIGGRIEGNILKGGTVELLYGPWQFVNNDYRGTVPNTYSYAVLSAHFSHDLVVKGNKARPVSPSGKTWRFLVQTGRGCFDLVEENTVVGIGPRDDDTIPNANAPEIVLTESYSLNFEGIPRAISADGRVVAIPRPQGEPARSGDIIAVLSGPQAGTWRRIAQPISSTVYLLESALPNGVADQPIAIASGFVNETYRKNTIDARGSSVAACLVLVGNHFGLRVEENQLMGAGEAFKITAAPTERPVIWGWSHAPCLGAIIRGNTITDSLRGGTLSVEHSAAIKSSKGRVYLTATLDDNRVRWSPEFVGRSRTGSAELPTGFTFGDPGSIDVAECVISETGNRAEVPTDAKDRPPVRVHAARLNGREIKGQTFALKKE